LNATATIPQTPAAPWILGREHIFPGTFIAAVGADNPDEQEIEPALLAQSSVVCDLAHQCMEVGDLHRAVRAGLLSPQLAATVYERANCAGYTQSFSFWR
jgi:ornithine cyclodeaminase/alanine dehydrogenase-like protein (mu-crystallin family)